MKEPNQKLVKARVQLLLKEPFFGALVLKLRLVEDNSIETMCTNGTVIKYNNDFVESLSDEETKGVLCHEVLHCALGHVFRLGNRDAPKFNVACVTGDTLITMQDHSMKPIHKVSVGDIVLAHKEEKLVPSTVLRVIKKVAPIVELDLTKGSTLKCSPTHKLLTDRGYIHAEDLRVSDNLVVDRRSCEILEAEYRYNGSDCDSRFPSTKGRASVLLPEQEQSISVKKNSKKKESEKHRQAFKNRLSIYSRNCRWGRYRNNFQNQEKVLQASHRYIYNQSSFSRLFRGFRNARSSVQKWKRKPILENNNKWVPNRRSTEITSTLLNYKERAYSFNFRIYQDSIKAEQKRSTYYKNEGYPLSGEGIELKRISAIRRSKEKREVFDLTTTEHTYISEGIISHNCDLAINPLLLNEYSYTLPEGALYDSAYLGMGAEEIYSKLPPTPEGESAEMWGGIESPVEGEGESKRPIAEQEAEWRISTKVAAEEAKGIGKLPGSLKELLLQGEPIINWRAQLSQLIGGISRTDFSWYKPDSAYLGAGMYLPTLNEPCIGHLVLAIDTSGSVHNEELEQFFGELSDVLDNVKFESLTVIQCDTQINDIKVYGMGDVVDTEVVGRGGTRVAPVFDWIQDEASPSALIYFTDMGICDFPEEAPEYPVYWARTSSSYCDAPFGTHIDLFNGD